MYYFEAKYKSTLGGCDYLEQSADFLDLREKENILKDFAKYLVARKLRNPTEVWMFIEKTSEDIDLTHDEMVDFCHWMELERDNLTEEQTEDDKENLSEADFRAKYNEYEKEVK